MSITPERLHRIHDRETLIGFLRDDVDGLGWDIPVEIPVEDMFYDYSAGMLRLNGEIANRVHVEQLANLVPNQPWGIFLVETATDKLYLTQVRQILRGLAPSARQHSHLRGWDLENLLFIATHNYEQFTFAHFKGDKPTTAVLSSFGWARGDTGLYTLCKNNLPALRWVEDPNDTGKWLRDWSSAFDLQAVSDRFYKDFAKLFEETKAALPKTIKRPADRHAFTQRLLNRLLFLSFLQKKRWLRHPELPKPDEKYLFQLYDDAKARGENYYANYLQDLFFNALNRPLSQRGRDYNRIILKLGIVPFLNGGLFDPTDELDAPDAVELPNKLFEPILGEEGLLRRHNFTVTESTPLNQEVAVDPEMLGKVFETVVLTSEEAQDYQAPNLRKATGSYYTPRIVVTFIVREVLKDYLVTRIPSLNKPQLTSLMELDAASGLTQDVRDQLKSILSQAQARTIRKHLDTLTACDPAIGSGAFALGLLHEIVNLNLLCETLERGKDPRTSDPNFVFNLKRRTIENNIYGVDLQAKAVEICKLRLWLSLIVDYELAGVDPKVATEEQYRRAIEEILPLPNLSYKIRRGDALLDLVQGHVFQFQDLARSGPMQDARTALVQTHQEFFREQDLDAKRVLRRDALLARTLLTRLQLQAQRDLVQNTGKTQLGMFDKESKTKAKARQAQLDALDSALVQVTAIQTQLAQLQRKQKLTQKDDELLTDLEASSEGDAITFTWELDFPEIFAQTQPSAATMTGKMQAVVNQAGGQMELAAPANVARGGFDIIVGNPPFVTARNEEKRKAYLKRWVQTCYMNYQLVAPFFERSFGLLKIDGHLGFIVSNAFARREFGKPMVEKFFPTVNLEEVVDCSGLMFPGHGTPTCIVLATAQKPDMKAGFRVTVTLPGGGDLRTPPENSPLWATIQAHHDETDYQDERISVTNRLRSDLAVWPWAWDASNEPTRKELESVPTTTIGELISEPIGRLAITSTDEVFIVPQHMARRMRIELRHLRFFATGETFRDWAPPEYLLAVFPYNRDLKPLDPHKSPKCIEYLASYRKILDNVIMHGTVKKKETTVNWFEYSRISRAKLQIPLSIVIPEIATHNHALVDEGSAVYNQTVPTIKLQPNESIDNYHLIAAILNSSTALFWLKLVCFSKREGEDAQSETYYVFAGNKLQELMIPNIVLKDGGVKQKVSLLSRDIWERGQRLPRLALRKLFEKKDEGYYGWNSSLEGWVSRHAVLPQTDFQASHELIALHDAALAEREHIRDEMIARQEEMDWLVYAAYGLISEDHPAVGNVTSPEPLALGERPFELVRDNKPIPEHFSPERRALWQARLDLIASNEHIRRIEQPIYKRRWYRKESDEQEFRRAFDWWMLEKAEWWLEHKTRKPVTLEEWADALWQDQRIRAAVQVVAPFSPDTPPRTRLTEDAPVEFVKLFKSIVIESTVPDWIPAAMEWEHVEKKFKNKVPARVKRIRGKLNVPRERFRTSEDGKYYWAGKRD